MRIRHALLEGYTYLGFAACMVAFLPVVAAACVRHRDDAVPRVPGRRLRQMGRVATRLSPIWRFHVKGRAPADIRSRAYVVVSNHASNADPFLLSHLPWDMRWIAKEELFKVPVVGWLLKMSGDIAIRRGDGDSIRKMLAEAKETLDGGLSVMIFPEGTRSRDGRVQRFKDGAFKLAIDAQVPVLPIAIDGTRDCMPKKSMGLGRARAHATILEPIETAGMGPSDLARLREMARARIATALEASRPPS
jgi:1-acyl-sn-glycerol-3-phosphate acyltransferase